MKHIYKMLLLLAAVLLTPLLSSCEKEKIVPDDNGNIETGITITEAKQTASHRDGNNYIFDISVTAKCDSKFDDWGVSLNRTLNGKTEEVSSKAVGSSNITGSRTFTLQLTIPEGEMNTTSNPHKPKATYSAVPYMKENGKDIYKADGKVTLALECEYVEPTTGTINGHDWVDLGLPSGVKWATCNVGASSPEGYGNYYAWGETHTMTEYTPGNCSTWEEDLGDISGNVTYDVARANWGSTWRIPTGAEMVELKNNCTWEWTSQGGHNGYKVTGPNGNSIFLPAAGFLDGSLLYRLGGDGLYWSSTPYESNTHYAYYLYFYSSNYVWGYNCRYYGLSVRPVSD